LEPLPYPKDALTPHISRETVEFHYEKHHRGYVNKLNDMAKASQELKDKSIDDIIKGQLKGFNNAAQAWNHTFYWHSMRPSGGGLPQGKIAAAIDNSFGNFDSFKQKFSEVAGGHFGSGWAWLVKDPKTNKLEILDTHDAHNPINVGKIPIITCDVWEHAYYIDYRNDRAKYLTSWWNLVNWEFAEKNFEKSH